MIKAAKLTNCSKLRSYKNTNFNNKCIIFQNCTKLTNCNIKFDAETVFMDNCHESFVNTWLVPEVFPHLQKLYLSSPFNMNTLDMFEDDYLQFYLSNKHLPPYNINKNNLFVVKHEQIKNLISKYASESLIVRTKDDL